VNATRRALLFVPATAERFIAKAHERGADAIIVDLEDSIPQSEKSDARKTLPGVIETLASRSVEIWVRINNDPGHLIADLAAAVRPGVSGLMAPKIENVAVLASIDRTVSEMEATQGMTGGQIRLCATLETPVGILNAGAIAAGPRLAALAFGIEDLSAAMGVRPSSSFARGPAQWVALAAAGARLESWGLAGSIAEFSRPSAFARSVALSKALGLTTILCVHPRQVEIAMAAYRPTETEAAWAAQVVDAYDAARQRGIGSISLDGRMIDEPVYRRAQSILARTRAAGAAE
jgi:citrate lyase subunit beta/citryl-CoA lyase